MPKSKASKAKPAPSNARNRPVLVTNPADPPGLQVGLPQVPALYGLKPRKQYLPWTHVRERLARSRNYWICTTRPDGRPHSIPVWGFFFDDVFYFGTGRSTRKARNLAQNPALSIHLDSGDDVVILEGTAKEVAESDTPTLAKLDSASREKYKMPLMTIPNETVLYAVRPRVVLAWTEQGFPKDATRWQLNDAVPS
jgi:nitroimidazol reductase NimA-like FMN-containing flavoprotein (pyridoxamine 5'-phosphate oxidase superfamily)